MGIEPTPSAWKAEVLPLNYTRKYSYQLSVISWRGKDSNLRRHSRQIYSLLHLTALEPLQYKISRLFCVNHTVMSTQFTRKTPIKNLLHLFMRRKRRKIRRLQISTRY